MTENGLHRACPIIPKGGHSPVSVVVDDGTGGIETCDSDRNLLGKRIEIVLSRHDRRRRITGNDAVLHRLKDDRMCVQHVGEWVSVEGIDQTAPEIIRLHRLLKRGRHFWYGVDSGVCLWTNSPGRQGRSVAALTDCHNLR